MPDTLFYDGSCPLCIREINLLERYMDANLQLVDIHSNDREKLATEFSKNQLLSILHLKTEKGHWLRGIDATVAAWQHTRVGWVLSPLRWPGINALADWAYFKWADKRACRLGYTKSCRIKASD